MMRKTLFLGIMLFLFILSANYVNALSRDYVVPLWEHGVFYFDMSDEINMNNRYFELHVPDYMDCVGDCNEFVDGRWQIHTKDGRSEEMTLKIGSDDFVTLRVGAFAQHEVEVIYSGFDNFEEIIDVRINVYEGEWNYQAQRNFDVGVWSEPFVFDNQVLDVSNDDADVVITLRNFHDRVDWHTSQIQYREAGTSSWSTTSISDPSPGSGSYIDMFEKISNLDAGVEYEWRPRFEYTWYPARTGAPWVISGDIKTFTTELGDEPNIAWFVSNNVGKTYIDTDFRINANDWDSYEWRVMYTDEGISEVLPGYDWTTDSGTTTRTVYADDLDPDTTYTFVLEVAYDPNNPSGTNYDRDNPLWEYVQETTDPLDPPTVSTEGSSISNGQLRMEMDYDFNDWNRVRVWFQYREDGGSWQSTSKSSRTSGSTHTRDISIHPDKDYEFRAKLEYDSGNPDGQNWDEELTGNTRSFSVERPSVSTNNPSDVDKHHADMSLSYDTGEWHHFGDVKVFFMDGDNQAIDGSDGTSVSGSGTHIETWSDLDADTEYSYRSWILWTYDGTQHGNDQGSVISFTTDPFVPPEVSNIDSNVIDYESAELSFDIDKNDWNEVFYHFRYRVSGGHQWEYSSGDSDLWHTVFSTTESKVIDGLEDDTPYEFQLVLNYNDDPDGFPNGDNVITSDTYTFTTDEFITPTVTTEPVSDKVTIDGESSATLNGFLDMGDWEGNVNVWFEFNGDTVGEQQMSSSGDFDYEKTGLESDTQYSYRAVVQYDTGQEYGADYLFTTPPDDAGIIKPLQDVELEFNEDITINLDEYFFNYDYIEVEMHDPEINDNTVLDSIGGGSHDSVYFHALMSDVFLTLTSKEEMYDNSVTATAFKDNDVSSSFQFTIVEPEPYANFEIDEPIDVELPTEQQEYKYFNLSVPIDTNYPDRVNNDSMTCEKTNANETQTYGTSGDCVREDDNGVLFLCPFMFNHDDADVYGSEWYVDCSVEVDNTEFSVSGVEMRLFEHGQLTTPPDAGTGSGIRPPTYDPDRQLDFDIDEFYINPTTRDVYMSPGERRLIEFRVINTYPTSLNFTTYFNPDKPTFPWMSFHQTDTMTQTYFQIEKTGGIGSDSTYVRFYVQVPDDIEYGTYTGEVFVETLDRDKILSHNVNIHIGESIIMEFLSRTLYQTDTMRITYGMMMGIVFTVLFVVIVLLSTTTGTGKNKGDRK